MTVTSHDCWDEEANHAAPDNLNVHRPLSMNEWRPMRVLRRPIIYQDSRVGLQSGMFVDMSIEYARERVQETVLTDRLKDLRWDYAYVWRDENIALEMIDENGGSVKCRFVTQRYESRPLVV
ncbi:hypothetical protein HDV00_004251 [Rhizophlyctis rosea]|nr:hypothetical protein HDV00_004251 [Rhizophlyctis rosea]